MTTDPPIVPPSEHDLPQPQTLLPSGEGTPQSRD